MIKPYFSTKLGQLFNGDCLEVLKDIPDNSIDMIMTDPPYGHNNNNGDLISNRERALGRKRKEEQEEVRPIANDGEEANDLFKKCLTEFYRVLVPGGCCCCCCGGGPDPQFARWSLWMDEVFEFKQMVVWDKGPMGMGWHYRRSYEVVLVAQKSGASCKWYDTTSRIENIIRDIGKIIPSKKDHPTPKPVALMAHFIKLHSQRGEVVLDPFCGGGSTLVACEQLGRKWIGIEIDKQWLSGAVARIKQESKQGKLGL
jgi:site-specific DNA-methyltransferase (adenine-specific)